MFGDLVKKHAGVNILAVVLDIFQIVKAGVSLLILHFMNAIAGRIMAALLENVLKDFGAVLVFGEEVHVVEISLRVEFVNE